MPVWVYNICAIVGGTLFLCQLLMMLLGFGGDHDADAGADHDLAADHDASSGGDHEHSQGFALHSLLSMRAIVAGVTLFGLTGRAVGGSTLGGAALAAGAGAAGLFLVGLLMRSLSKLEAEGTVHIEQALGEEATVYLTIPAHNSGAGKITVQVQNRLMEYRAITDCPDAIPTGAPVEVTDLVDEETLKVAPLPKTDAPAVRAEENSPVTGEKASLARRTEEREHG